MREAWSWSARLKNGRRKVMAKYASHDEFAGNAPPGWREGTTFEAYTRGMTRIAPPGMRPRVRRGRRFEKNTGMPESARWHHNYDHAMFGGSCIERPSAERKQLDLERIFRHQ